MKKLYLTAIVADTKDAVDVVAKREAWASPVAFSIDEKTPDSIIVKAVKEMIRAVRRKEKNK